MKCDFEKKQKLFFYIGRFHPDRLIAFFKIAGFAIELLPGGNPDFLNLFEEEYGTLTINSP